MSLIRVKASRSTTSHPNRNVQGETQARRLLEKGMARVALKQRFRAGGLDAYGKPLHRAAELEASTSSARLERLARGWSGGVGKPTQWHCLACSRAGMPDPWHPVGALCLIALGQDAP